jgi:Predicted membrane protein
MKQENQTEVSRKTADMARPAAVQRVHVEQSEIYEGPLPHPDIVKAFKEIDPSFPDRIFSMAEKHADADIRMQDRISKANLITPILGQIFTFLLGALGIGAGVFLAMKGMTGGAIASIIGGFSPIVINALRNLRK